MKLRMARNSEFCGVVRKLGKEVGAWAASAFVPPSRVTDLGLCIHLSHQCATAATWS